MSDHSRSAGDNRTAEATMIHQLLAALETYGAQVAITVDDGAGVTDWTYQDLLERTRREARRLEALGVERGTIVAVMTGDHPVTFALRWAINALGATANVLVDGFAAAALAEVLDVTRPQLLLTDGARHDLGVSAADRAGRVSVEDIDATPPPADASPIEVRAERGALAAVQLTSGTTGTPKAVPRRMAPPAPATALKPWRDSVQLLCTPVAHVGGAVAILVLRAGGRVVLQPGFEPGRVLAAIQRERVTVLMPLFPRHLVGLLDHPDLPRTDTSSLRSLRLGGAAASPARIGEAIERFGPIVSEVYGTIEATNIASITAEELTRAELRGTVGRPEAGVELSLRDEDGDEVPIGEIGEVWVRSPAIMPGYLNAPQDTAAVLQQGWLRTGDLGRLDAQGYLSLAGRVKDLIYAERARIYPPEVENTLAEHPDVASVAVFGITDSDGVESAAAAVVPRNGRAPGSDELIAWVAEGRGPRLAPSAVYLVDELPTVASGKIDRSALRQQYTS